MRNREGPILAAVTCLVMVGIGALAVGAFTGRRVFAELLAWLAGAGAVAARRTLARWWRSLWEAIVPVGGRAVEGVGLIVWTAWGMIALLAASYALVARIVDAV